MRFRPTRRKLDAPTRAAVLRGVALLALVAHGASVGHDLLERHELCAEHGELVHAGSVHGHGAGDGRSNSSGAGDTASVVRDAADAAEHGHEHCGLACSRSKLTVGAQASTALQELGVTQVVPEPNAVVTRDGAVLRHLAPKQSPPA